MAKRTLALALALMLVLSLSAVSAEKLDYVNYDGLYPLIKEGTDVKLTMYASAQDGAKDPEEAWLWTFLQQKLNLDLEITLVPFATMGEQLTLIMASGSMPDILYNFQLSGQQRMMYGDAEGQWLVMNDYINEENTPWMSAWFEKLPEIRAAWTTPTGNIYSLSNFGQSGGMGYGVYVRTDWLEDCGLEMPKTLDEFTEMLRAFKAKYPDCIPLGGEGGYGADDSRGIILSALGFVLYLNRSGHTTSATMLGDEVVIPGGHPLYKEYLSLLKTYHDEGLMSQDYFTDDYKIARARAYEGVNGVYTNWTIATISNGEYDFATKWQAMSPLTSQWNDTPVAQSAASVTFLGDFVVNAETQYPEVALKFADWFFSDDALLYQAQGAMKGTEETLGMIEGWYVDPESELNTIKSDDAQLDIISSYVAVGNSRGTLDGQYTVNQYMQVFAGVEPTPTDLIDTTTIGGYDDAMKNEALKPYLVDGYPSYVYFSEEDSIRMTDLASVIKEYINTETAKFVTGARSLDEFDAYLAELEAIGFSEYLGYYQEAYEVYMENLNG